MKPKSTFFKLLSLIFAKPLLFIGTVSWIVGVAGMMGTAILLVAGDLPLSPAFGWAGRFVTLLLGGLFIHTFIERPE